MKLLSAFLIAIVSTSALAAPVCEDLFARRQPYSQLKPLERRARLIEELKAADVPAFLKKTEVGDIPVILVTEQSSKPLARFLANSMGQQTYLQPGTPYSDHGLIRLGDRLMDWAMPDTRNHHGDWVAEIHSSGIAWRSLKEKLARSAKKDGDTKVTMEVAYSVTPKQRADLEFYHRIRRATLIAVQSKNPRGEMKPSVPNLLPEWLFEGCFNFCSGNILDQMRGLTAEKLQPLGIENVDQLLRNRDVRSFLASAREIIMKKDPMDPWWFHHRTLIESPGFEQQAQTLVTKLGLKVSNDPEMELFINTLVSYEAMIGAERVMHALGVGQNIAAGANVDNPNVAAILVYASASQAPRFRDASFTTTGYFEGTGWGEDPQGTRPYRDQRPLK